jgi:pimeloyl-ACP methyl ester carboxylesterase
MKGYLMRLSLILLFLCSLPVTAAEPKPFPGTATKWNGFDKFVFPFDGTDITMVQPEKALPGRPWIWRAEFFDSFPKADIALVKAGWHLAYLRVPNLFGSPKAIARWEKCYDLLTKEYGLHPKPGFIGLSRGGLYAMNWAAVHPEKTLAVYLDNAVCDFKSWPGGKPKKLGTGAGSPNEWLNVLKAFDFKDDEEAIAYKLNPIDNLKPVADAKIPLLLVYGDADRAVPHLENSEIVYKRYTELKGSVTRIVKPGQDHHPHGLEDVKPVVDFFNAALSSK